MANATTATPTPHTGLWASATCLECAGLLEPVTTPASNGRHSSAVMRCTSCPRSYLLAFRLEPLTSHTRRG
jgi:hypothetical protein